MIQRFLSCFIILSLLFAVPARAADDDKAKELFLVAQRAFDDGFYDVAMRYIEQLLTEYPQTEKRIQANLLLGQCHFFKTQYLKAYEIFQSLLPYNEFKDATLFWLGETYLKGADYKQAETHFKQLLEVYKDSAYVPQGYYSLAWVYYEQNQQDTAKQYFIKLIQLYPAHQLSEDALFKLGEIEYNRGAYEEAIELYENYIFKYPQSNRHAESYFYIGESYYFLGNYLSAITYYAKAAELGFDHKLIVMARISLGWSYLKLERFDSSQKYFGEALKLAEEKGLLTDDIFLGQASLYSEMEDYPKALKAYSDLIQKFPESTRLPESYLGRANTLYALKDYSNAITEYQAILAKYSVDAKQKDTIEKAHFGLAWTYLKMGDIDTSIKNFQSIMEATDSKTVKISVLTQIGDAYQDSNDLEKAIEVYDRILKDFPDSLYTDYVQFRQGIALLKLNKTDMAAIAFQTLKANFPGSKYLREANYYLGVAYFKKGDWATAKENAEGYLKDPLNQNSELAAEAYYILASANFNLNEFEEAQDHFERIVKNYSEQISIVKSAQLGLAKCLYQTGGKNEALTKFQTITTDYPQSDIAQEALLWLGDFYLENADYPQAIQYYERLIAEFPDGDKVNLAHYELGQAYAAQQLFDRAIEQFKKITDPFDREIYAKAHLAIADIFAKKDSDSSDAIKTYLNITETSPDFSRDAFIKIAGIHEKNKEHSQMIEFLQKALAAPIGLSQWSNSQIQFQIADTYEMMNNSDKAVEEYLKIPYLYAKNTSWVVKAYLRVAQIMENKNDWEQAKTIYQKIIDYKVNESKYAQERLQWIKNNPAGK